MAGGKEPPDRNDDKTYKCHPKQKVTTVICLICDNNYHLSDFKQLNEPIFLSQTLVICPNHPQLDLTSTTNKIVLNEPTRKLIAQIKSERKEIIKQEILKEIAKETKDDLNNTFSNLEEENLQKEIILLRQLNKEIMDKNVLLKELLEKEKDNSTLNKKTFSEVVSKTTVKLQPKSIPKIFIRKKDKNDTSNIKDSVVNCLIKEKTIRTKNMILTKGGDLIISCDNEDSVMNAEKVLQGKLSKNYQIEKENLLNPKLKIIGIDKNANFDPTKLQSDINARNFNNSQGICKILHMYSTNNGSQSAIAEVPPEIYKSIMQNGSRIYVGFQCCKVYDFINISPCYNCGRVGHSGAKCKNPSKCLKCAGNHNTRNCENSLVQCINCIYHNTQFKTNFDVSHVSTDSAMCQYLQNKIKKLIEATDYPLNPNIPRYLGNAANFSTKRNNLEEQESTTLLSSATKSESTSGSQQKNLNKNGQSS